MRLQAMEETQVVQYLDRTYTSPVPDSLLRNVHECLPEHKFADWWAGCYGIAPGTGCGSEPAEAIHSKWQTDLERPGGRVPMGQVSSDMQNVYVENWAESFEWGSADLLTATPVDVDPTGCTYSMGCMMWRVPCASQSSCRTSQQNHDVVGFPASKHTDKETPGMKDKSDNHYRCLAGIGPCYGRHGQLSGYDVDQRLPPELRVDHEEAVHQLQPTSCEQPLQLGECCRAAARAHEKHCKSVRWSCTAVLNRVPQPK